MIKKKIIAAFFLAPVAIVVISQAQTSQDQCPSGIPKCYRDLAPYAGHNLSASQLPPNLCPNGCSGDNRRVIVIRFDSSWGTTTNSNIWDATHCAAAAWNNAVDASGNKIGYYFAVDQGNLTNVATADITVVKETPADGIAACNVGHDNANPNRQNVIKLDQVNGDLGVGAGLNFDANYLCGRVAHELGHLIGVDEVPNCKSIMFGVNSNGSRDVDTVQHNDVAQANRNFNSATRDNCQSNTPNSEAAESFAPTPTPTPEEECPDNGNQWICNQDHAVWWPYPYCECAYTPIVIDIDGDGFQLTNAAQGVWFDISGHGTKQWVAWTAMNSADAWLTLDVSRNGMIDSGDELFGNNSQFANGFLKLAEYDKLENGGNRDGLIDNGDAIFSSLLLWRDANHNGISELSELNPLPSVGVESISLDYRESRRHDEFRNEFRYRAKVYGTEQRLGRWAYDVVLSPAK